MNRGNKSMSREPVRVKSHKTPQTFRNSSWGLGHSAEKRADAGGCLPHQQSFQLRGHPNGEMVNCTELVGRHFFSLFSDVLSTADALWVIPWWSLNLFLLQGCNFDLLREQKWWFSRLCSHAWTLKRPKVSTVTFSGHGYLGCCWTFFCLSHWQ